MEACVAATDAGIMSLPLGENAVDRWQTDWRLAGGEGFSVLGTETISVPAGQFECTRVRRTAADGSVLAEGWFAEGAGLVKCAWPAQGVSQELVGYTLSGDKGKVARAAE